jgi:hypothetical protein
VSKAALKRQLVDIQAKRIVSEHILCNVTALFSEMREHDVDLGAEMLDGHPEDTQRAYEALEVWAVTSWLADKLKRHDHRVLTIGGWDYWARGGSGQSLYMDTVIQEIAKRMEG